MRLVLGDGSLKIMGRQRRAGRGAGGTRSRLQGDPIDVGFNVGYLLDVLNNTASETIECGLQRCEFERPAVGSGQRPLQVCRDADAHLDAADGRRGGGWFHVKQIWTENDRRQQRRL